MKIYQIQVRQFILLTALLLAVTSVLFVPQSSYAQSGDCVIPPSGPWPPCATGGTTPPTTSPDDCVIPPSGPWPPCATGGGGSTTPPPTTSPDDCIIPPSGPWPPCATGGSGGATPTPAPPNPPGSCVIPESGPWPPCATGGSSEPPTTTPVPASENHPNNTIVYLDHTNSDLSVGDFVRFVGTITKPSDQISLQWHVNGATNVSISYYPSNHGGGGSSITGGATGERTVAHSPEQGGQPADYGVIVDGTHIGRLFLSLPCEYPWNPLFEHIYDHLPRQECPAHDERIPAFQQNFEGGFMLWMESGERVSTRLVRVLGWDGVIYGTFEDTFVHSADPVNDPSIVPPAGRHQPEYGVGKVWRENPHIREAMGWAIEQGGDFTTHHQHGLLNRYAQHDYYYTLRDGGFMMGNSQGYPWTVRPARPPAHTSPVHPANTIEFVDHTNSDLPEGDFVRFVGNLTKPSDELLLQWHFANTRQTSFNYSSNDHEFVDFSAKAGGSGELTVTHAPSQGGQFAMYTIKANEYPGTLLHTTAITLALPCEYTWNPVFNVYQDQFGECAAHEGHYQAFQQNFEGGLILWRQEESRKRIFVVSWDGTYKGIFDDTFQHGVDPINDPSIVPPNGRHQPEYGVGKLWRENPEVREKLGWATDTGTDFTTQEQRGRYNRYAPEHTFYLLRNNGYMIVRGHGYPWEVYPAQP